MFQSEFGFGFDAQAENLERVNSRISKAVLQFCQSHTTFHADELRIFVISTTGIAAPASADRILRSLRQRGILSYIVEDRRASQYRVLAVRDGNKIC